MSILAYQFPNQEVKIYEGDWRESKLESLPEDHFFLTDFTKKGVFSFQEVRQLTSFKNSDLFFNEDNSVFGVSSKYYLNGLQHFMDGFESFGIKKAIYSRIKLVAHNQSDMFQLFKRLAVAYKNEALVYLVSDAKFGTWIGATPEVLLEGNQEKIHTMALAGTKLEASQEWTDKERVEHQYVVDYIKDKLEDKSVEKLKIGATETVRNGAIYHLRTPYEFKLSSASWNELIDSLHPTPAVCGIPETEAMDYILNLEPHSRELYTGMLGYRNKSEIKVYVNLRCLQVLESKYALYVGGGITQDSDIGKEWKETEDKSNTLLSIIEE